MKFSEVFNKYFKMCNVSAKELSKLADVDESVICKYKKGDRLPKADSNTVFKLTKAISELTEIDEEEILNNFNKVLKKDNESFRVFVRNLNYLIAALNINVSNMAKTIGYDSSYISKIRSNERIPAKIENFKNEVFNYIVNKFQDVPSKKAISAILECPMQNLDDKEEYKNTLIKWMALGDKKRNDFVTKFFKTVNDFNIDEYLKKLEKNRKNIKKDITLDSKVYYGEKMSEAQIEFLKYVLLTSKNDDIFLYSNMPLNHDIETAKKVISAFTMIARENNSINIIHDLNRPVNEIIMGLIAWIPIHMIGNVNSYYLKERRSSIYTHIEGTSSKIGFSGLGITGHPETDKFYLTTNKEEVEYYKLRDKEIMKKAIPLLKVYNENSKEKFSKTISEMKKFKNDRHNYLCTLPIYTMSEELLLKILKRNKVNEETKEEILKFYHDKKDQIKTILKNNKIIDKVNNYKKEDFHQHLSLSEMFLDETIHYTYAEYVEHEKETLEFMKQNENYIFAKTNNIFNNIKISLVKGKLILVSKEMNPTIHFIVDHPDLRKTIENLEIHDNYTI